MTPPKLLTFWDWYDAISSEGRITRLHFWVITCRVYTWVLVLGFIFDQLVSALGLAALAPADMAFILLYVPGIVRRLRDVGLSGRWLFAPVLPFAALAFLDFLNTLADWQWAGLGTQWYDLLLGACGAVGLSHVFLMFWPGQPRPNAFGVPEAVTVSGSLKWTAILTAVFWPFTVLWALLPAILSAF